MPMGIVSDEEFDTEIDKLTPNNGGSDGKSIAIVKEIERGRGKDNLAVPESLRKVVGEESVINGRASALELASNFDISPSSVSAYSHGAHSTATYENRPDLEGLNQARLRVAKRARNKLILALNNLTQEKIESAKAKDISSVARDMSAVIKDMEPETPRNPDERRGPTFIFYSPQFRKEEHFEIVHVKE